ncbi:unnamed protein product [Dicrocoelium dendriticum]|nr:unnamed protein product [Dicrocoelium dendriticum]
MEFHCSINAAAQGQITALSCDNSRREVICGTENGTINFWDVKLMSKISEQNVHYSWITCIWYWEKQRTVISTSQNGRLVFWQGLMPTEVLIVYQPIYITIAVDRIRSLICGVNDGLITYDLDPRRLYGTFIIQKSQKKLRGHKDIVQCLTQSDHRLYSAGFDGRLVVFDSSGNVESTLNRLRTIRGAHSGIISCLTTARNAENQFVLLSGGFDRFVKLWNEEGQLMSIVHRCSEPITSMTFVPMTNTFWVAFIHSAVRIFDIQTAADVTDVCSFLEQSQIRKHHTTLLKCFHDLNLVVGSTDRSRLIFWRGNTSTSLSRMSSGAGIQTIVAGLHDPTAFFSTGTNDNLLKWERKDRTHFSYVSEEIHIHESMKQSLLDTVNQRLREVHVPRDDIHAFKAMFPPTIFLTSSTTTDRPCYSASCTSIATERSDSITSLTSRRSKQKTRDKLSRQIVFKIDENRAQTFLKAIYVKELDAVVAACVDGVVYVLGYDTEGTKRFLLSIGDQEVPISSVDTPACQKEVRAASDERLCEIMNILMSQAKKITGNDQVTCEPVNRPPSPRFQQMDNVVKSNAPQVDDEVLVSISDHLFGLRCRFALCAHKDCVTSVVVLPPKLNPSGTFVLLSSGWDRRIYIWDLERGTLIDNYRNTSCNDPEMQWNAADGAILDMAYSDELQEFAYCSSDWNAYVRRACVQGTQMHLVDKFVGHRADVTCVMYRPKVKQLSGDGEAENSDYGEWITGSYDCTIRVWPAHKNGKCRLNLHTGGPVICFTWEDKRGILVAGIDKDVKTYDLDTGHMYQHYAGHVDAIHSILALTEWDQYITAGADGQLRIWRAWTGTKMRSQSGASSPRDADDQCIVDAAFKAARTASIALWSNPAAAVGAAARAFTEVRHPEHCA